MPAKLAGTCSHSFAKLAGAADAAAAGQPASQAVQSFDRFWGDLALDLAAILLLAYAIYYAAITATTC